MESMADEFMVVCFIIVIGNLAPYWVPPALDVADSIVKKICWAIKVIKPEPYLQPADLGDWVH